MQHFIDLTHFVRYIFILFWSVNYIAFKVLLYLYGMLYSNGKIDHTNTVTVSRSKLIRSGSDLTKSHDGMNVPGIEHEKLIRFWFWNRNPREKCNCHPHKFQNGKDLYGNKEEFIIRGNIPQPCAYRTRLGAFTEVILPDLSTLTVAASAKSQKPPC